VNRIEELPPHYTDSDFWKHHGPRLLAFAGEPESEAFSQSRDVLLRHDRALVTKLLDLRFKLCEKYDLPAAPLSSTNE
jgi:hypothetical protein